MTEQQETVQTKKIKVTFNQNVKYGKDRYKKGDSLSVTKKVQEELEEAGVIE